MMSERVLETRRLFELEIHCEFGCDCFPVLSMVVAAHLFAWPFATAARLIASSTLPHHRHTTSRQHPYDSESTCAIDFHQDYPSVGPRMH